MTCPRCRYDHPPLSPTAWLWALRDAKERPTTAGHLGVLAMMAARVDPTTGCGWMRRADLIDDAGVKKETVTAAARWAIGAGLLARLVTGRGRGAAQASWSLFALADPSRAETGAPNSDSQGRKRAPLTPSQGRKRAQSKAEMGAPDVRPGLVRPEVPIPTPTGSAASRAETGAPNAGPAAPAADLALMPPAEIEAPPTAQALVAEWIDHCPHRPPARVVGQVARELGKLLDEGIAYEHVRAGLAAWYRKGDVHPATLASFVNTAMNGTGSNLTRRDERVLRGVRAAAEQRRREQEETR